VERAQNILFTKVRRLLAGETMLINRLYIRGTPLISFLASIMKSRQCTIEEILLIALPLSPLPLHYTRYLGHFENQGSLEHIKQRSLSALASSLKYAKKENPTTLKSIYQLDVLISTPEFKHFKGNKQMIKP
jgi:heme oxygenase